MKLIVQNGRIAGTATDSYNGPDGFVTAPEGFTIDRLADYTVVFDVATLPPPTVQDYDRALTDHLDSVAQAKSYTDRISCSVRAGYPGPFQAEGLAFASWMDACNAIGDRMLMDFQQGRIPQPTITEMLAALPMMVWPD